jgi:hypothetical protein
MVASRKISRRGRTPSAESVRKVCAKGQQLAKSIRA